jgi:hypothetical protein
LTSQLELSDQRKAREESEAGKEEEEKEPKDPPFRNLVIFYKFVDETQVSNLRKKRFIVFVLYLFISFI